MELRENKRKMKENKQQLLCFDVFSLKMTPNGYNFLYGWIGEFPIFPKRPYSLNLDFK